MGCRTMGVRARLWANLGWGRQVREGWECATHYVFSPKHDALKYCMKQHGAMPQQP